VFLTVDSHHKENWQKVGPEDHHLSDLGKRQLCDPAPTSAPSIENSVVDEYHN
jgi:hypothetical protein